MKRSNSFSSRPSAIRQDVTPVSTFPGNIGGSGGSSGTGPHQRRVSGSSTSTSPTLSLDTSSYPLAELALRSPSGSGGRRTASKTRPNSQHYYSDSSYGADESYSSISPSNRMSKKMEEAKGYQPGGLLPGSYDEDRDSRRKGHMWKTFVTFSRTMRRHSGMRLSLLVILVLCTGFWVTKRGKGVEKVPPRLQSGSTGKGRTRESAILGEPPSISPLQRGSPFPLDVEQDAISRESITVMDVDVNPNRMEAPSIAPDEKFLSYLPHSGYHNQRISLENALTLSFILNRTLLVPPALLGHAVPYANFDRLLNRLKMVSKHRFQRCREAGEGGSEDYMPAECLGYFTWTQVSWDFMVNLTESKILVKTLDRWRYDDHWLREEIGVSLDSNVEGSDASKEDDVYYLRDQQMYQYRFYDKKEDQTPLAKFERRIDIEQLKEDSSGAKLLHVSSLFGTSRIHLMDDTNIDARSVFRRSMVFRQPLVDDITAEVRDRLGGSGNYYGLHLRVGDGIFQKEAKANMQEIWTQLCQKKMKLSPKVCDEAANLGHPRQESQKRVWKERPPFKHVYDTDDASFELPEEPLNVRDKDLDDLQKRQNSRPQRKGAYDHAPLPKLPVIASIADSPIQSAVLKCRGKLHTKATLLPFNAPLFIATDSPVPESDSSLSTFFAAFPCTFVLSDFQSSNSVNSEIIPSFSKLAGMRNMDDRVPLARFFYPQLDAQIAAYGRAFLGTPSSTYSRFAADVLHQVYHDWEIIERG